MQADLPHTLYLGRKKKHNGPGEPFHFNENDPAIQRQIEANRRAAERRAAMGNNPSYTMNDIFKK